MGRLYSCLQTVQLKIEKALLPWKPIMYFAYFVSTSCRIARWWSWRHQPLQLMRSLVLVGSGCRALQVREGLGVIEMPVFWAFLGRESNAKEPLKFEVDKIVFFVLWSSMILRLRQCNFFQDVFADVLISLPRLSVNPVPFILLHHEDIMCRRYV